MSDEYKSWFMIASIACAIFGMWGAPRNFLWARKHAAVVYILLFVSLCGLPGIIAGKVDDRTWLLLSIASTAIVLSMTISSYIVPLDYNLRIVLKAWVKGEVLTDEMRKEVLPPGPLRDDILSEENDVSN